MFLGITYNRWHFILTLLGTVGIFLTAALVLLPYLGILLRLPVSAFIAFLGWSYAQMANETYQLFDDKVKDIYGSYENFVTDSRDDWRNCWWGYLLGLTVSLIIYMVIL